MNVSVITVKAPHSSIPSAYEMYTYCDKHMQLGIITASVQFSSNIFWSRVGICNDIVAGWFDENSGDKTRHDIQVEFPVSRHARLAQIRLTTPAAAAPPRLTPRIK